MAHIGFEEAHAVDLVDLERAVRIVAVLLVEEGEVEDNAYVAVVVVAALLAGVEAVVEQVVVEQLAFSSLLASVF